MKIKGISFVEQHIEKIVLGVAALGLVGVAVWQFALRSNTVTMGGREVPPGAVDRELVERATALADRLRDDAPADLSAFDRPPTKGAAELAEAMRSKVSGTERLARLSPALGARLLPIDLGADTWYFEPRPGAPAILAEVVQTADALDDRAVIDFPELAARFRGSGPKDIVWTTPAAVIDPAALRSELRRAELGANPPKSQVPTPWYNDALMIVDVVFERETLRPDGSWGDRVEVQPIPGQLSYRPQIVGGADAAFSQRLLGSLATPSVQQQILQPEFLPTRNSAFVQPSMPVASASASGNEAAEQLLDLLTRLRDERSRKDAELTRLGGPLEDDRRDRREERDESDRGGSGSGAPPPGGGLGGGFSGPRGGSTDRSEADAEREKRRRQLLTRELRRLAERITRVERELGEIAPELLADRSARGTGVIDLAGETPVLVWAHDLGVEPGRTYRYRAMARLFNPFFARSRQLVAEQARLAESLALPTAWSEWSRPVDVTPPVAFFLTRAAPGEGPLGAGIARFEIYRLHDGKWRRDEMSVSPGDRVGRVIESARGGLPIEAAAGAAPVAIDFGTEWYVVDIIEDFTAERRSPGDLQRAGIVVLQRADGQRIELREPQRDLGSEQRRRLNRDWKVGSLS
ncbi:MAG TPA: hypothetical protein PKC43_14555 [Phycisphaerales bacterium]|nr:hypothetical protein [Phycisphaerales bacterium]HMP38655.1 hypothetical protein [Phycisphaerales bacterium]